MLTRERQVLVMQIEALRAEAQQAEKDLQEQHHRHQTELHCLREESLQVGVHWVSETFQPLLTTDFLNSTMCNV